MIQESPLPNQKISILFKNNTSAQGIVISWSEQKAILKSIHNNNIFIIYNIQENVQMVYIELEPIQLPKETEENWKPPTVKLSQRQENKTRQAKNFAQPQIKSEPLPLDLPLDIELRAKKLQDLQILKAEEEKKQAVEAANSFKLQHRPLVQYASPSLSQQHFRKKTLRSPKTNAG